MTVKNLNSSLPGYEGAGTIQIDYRFPSGTQSVGWDVLPVRLDTSMYRYAANATNQKSLTMCFHETKIPLLAL